MAKFAGGNRAGKALMSKIITMIHQDLRSTEKQQRVDAMQKLVLRWIVACIYYVSRKHDQAESLWVGHSCLIIAGGKPVSKTALVFWGLSKGVDLSVYEPFIEALLQRAKAYSRQDGPDGIQFGFVMALVALSCCVTTGLHRTPSGSKILARIRIFLKPCWATKIDWNWIIGHAHVTRHDFVGVVSTLLTHTYFKPQCKMKAVMPRDYGRKAA